MQVGKLKKKTHKHTWKEIPNDAPIGSRLRRIAWLLGATKYCTKCRKTR